MSPGSSSVWEGYKWDSLFIQPLSLETDPVISPSIRETLTQKTTFSPIHKLISLGVRCSYRNLQANYSTCFCLQATSWVLTVVSVRLSTDTHDLYQRAEEGLQVQVCQ